MLKVLCINAAGLQRTYGYTVEENKVYEVIDAGEVFGIQAYLLHATEDIQHWYDAKRFIPLSDIDETVLQEQRTKKPACV